MGPLILLADCEVFYEGRASSVLRRGRYLLLRKPDGSFMVHGAGLTVPLNYQPAGSRLYRTSEGYFCQGKREEIRVLVHREITRLVPAQWDDHKIRLVRTERELCDRLAKSVRRRIPNVRRVYREFSTKYGPVDLVAVDHRGVYHVIEVKRSLATVQAAVQLRKYLETIADSGCRVRGYVAAPRIAEKARDYYRRHGYRYLTVRHGRAAADRPGADSGEPPAASRRRAVG